jgi:hypothetical protein
MFDVRHHPKGDPRAAGPFEQWARIDRRKGEELAIHRNGSAVGRLTFNGTFMPRRQKISSRGHQYQPCPIDGWLASQIRYAVHAK